MVHFNHFNHSQLDHAPIEKEALKERGVNIKQDLNRRMLRARLIIRCLLFVFRFPSSSVGPVFCY